jgi:pimeloyl-ACP methyl ester carboxylesterase
MRLDPRETHHLIPSPEPGLSLFLRRLPAESGAHAPVLYVHGATFPSALSIAHRLDGISWRDELSRAGFDVWGLDFLGFGESDRFPKPASGIPGRAETASRQVEHAARAIAERHDGAPVSLIAHSWGTIAACRFAARCPALVERIVLFGPIVPRDGAPPPAPPAFRDITLEAQWERFIEDVPAHEEMVLSRRHFDEWGERYLDSDPASRTRHPAAVRTPGGPAADIAAAHAGEHGYDAAAIRAPVAIMRGEWDHLCTDADARTLLAALSAAPIRRDVKIGRATHLMHLESARFALYRETETFLRDRDLVRRDQA